MLSGPGTCQDGPPICLVACHQDHFMFEGHLVATSVTPLITRVDSADLAGGAGVAFLLHGSICFPPEAACSFEEDNLPQ